MTTAAALARMMTAATVATVVSALEQEKNEEETERLPPFPLPISMQEVDCKNRLSKLTKIKIITIIDGRIAVAAVNKDSRDNPKKERINRKRRGGRRNRFRFV